MKRHRTAFAAIAVAAAIGALRADEGMWTFDNPPRAQLKERYGFEPSDAWLEHLRLASVRIIEGSTGGTASFVSPDGLLLTNQHVAVGQLEKLSTPESNLTRDGFYAATRGEELKCPDLEATVLVSFENVTDRIRAAVKPGASDADAAAFRTRVIAAIESASNEQTGLRSEVVSLYNGGEYWLYRFKRYTDLRLVFAPEEQIAYFGGDYDNFTFPRHDLDVSFLRAYENGQPARTPHYLRWSRSGAAEGELVLLAGVPGATDRLLTMTQIAYQRDTGNPLQRRVWESRRNTLLAYAKSGEEEARRAGNLIRSLENSLKRLVGQQAGLENPRIMQAKEKEERALRDAIAANPEWARAYSGAWRRIDDVYHELPAMAPRILFSTLNVSRLADHASSLIRYAEERRKPNDQRLEEYRDSRLETVRLNLLSEAPVYPELEEAILAGWLAEAQAALGDADPFVKAALAGRSPADAARGAIAGTTLGQIAARKALLDGGPAAIAASQDPLLALARRVEPILRELRAWQDQRLRSVEASAGQQIAEARFAVYGRSVYPDANRTLRLGYGKVAGYEEDTTLVPAMTTFHGLYDRALGFREKPPYDLPARWRTGRDKLDLATPLNFVYTGDTIGGNSGSPIVNRAGELVGLNFDSNQQKLPNRYLYIDDAEGSRAIAVHSAAILEAVGNLYGAGALVGEIAAARR